MFAVVQIPLTDFRPFQPTEEKVPFDWCTPDYNKTFLKCIGKIVERQTGGDYLFSNEKFFVNAKNCVKFDGFSLIDIEGFHFPKMKFTRFFVDEFGALRFEVGFVFRNQNHPLETYIEEQKLSKLVESILELEVRVIDLATNEYRKVPFHKVGSLLSKKFLYSTRLPNNYDLHKESINIGSPNIFIEYNGRKNKNNATSAPNPKSINCKWTRFAGYKVPVYLLDRRGKTWVEVRSYRIAIFRASAELHNLKTIIRNKQIKSTSFFETTLGDYLEEKHNFLRLLFDLSDDYSSMSRETEAALKYYKKAYGNEITLIASRFKSRFPKHYELLQQEKSAIETASQITTIEQLIAENKMSRAFSKVTELFKKFKKNISNLLVLESEFHDYSLKYHMDLVAVDEYTVRMNKIKKGLLFLVYQLLDD